MALHRRGVSAVQFHMFRYMDAYPPVPESVTNLLATLGDQQRQRVLNAFLAERVWELPVGVIVERCAPLSRPAVSHHLGIMRRTNVLIRRREGKHVHYALNREYIEQALHSFLAFLDVCGTPIAQCPIETGRLEATP
jgi:DNA-binding transcriptional ArsR family regulator